MAEETKTYYTSADLPVDDQDAKLQQLVGVFQATGVFTSQQVSDFNAQFQTLISRAEQLGGLGTVVSAAQITAAELQPRLDALETVRTQAAVAWNATVNDLDALQQQLSSGTDITMPTLSSLVAAHWSGS